MSTRQGGFTLVETVIFIVIVSVAVAAITMQFSQNVQHSASPLLRQKAIVLAQFYMDRMQTVRWDENTPVGGGATAGQSTPGVDGGEACGLATIDDFDDFDCFSAFDLGDGFTLDITVTNGSGGWDAIPATEYKQAVINVATPAGETLSVTLLRADY